MDHGNNRRRLGILSAPQRNNYFYGKLLDVPHLQMEQGYANRKRWLINRLGLGEGVLCGLDVAVKDGRICVAAGVAIDALGREIIVPEDVYLDPLLVSDDCGKPGGTPLELGTNYHLCLAYRECMADFMPMLVTDCNTREQCAPGTIVESYCLFVSEGDPAQPTTDSAICDALTGALDPKTTRRTKLAEQLSGACAAAPDKTCVVLAKVELELVKLEEPEVGVQVEVKTHEYQPAMVYSNARLLDFILCLAERGGGGAVGPQGPAGLGINQAHATTGKSVSATIDPLSRDIYFVIPPGKPGSDGLGINQAHATTGTPVSATIDPLSRDIYFVIPPGDPGFDPVLTHICDINWKHNDAQHASDFPDGLLLAFDRQVNSDDIHSQSFIVLEGQIDTVNKTICWCELQSVTISGIRFKAACKIAAGFDPGPNPADPNRLVNGAQFVPLNPLKDGQTYRVIVKGDFIRDDNGLGVDANHLPPWLPAAHTGDRVAGGTFESWFALSSG